VNYRNERTRAVNEWRRMPARCPHHQPSLGACFFAWLGALVADHFVAMAIAMLSAAFAAGVSTGALL
jgi:hypothetical protein